MLKPSDLISLGFVEEPANDTGFMPYRLFTYASEKYIENYIQCTISDDVWISVNGGSPLENPATEEWLQALIALIDT